MTARILRIVSSNDAPVRPLVDEQAALQRHREHQQATDDWLLTYMAPKRPLRADMHQRDMEPEPVRGSIAGVWVIIVGLAFYGAARLIPDVVHAHPGIIAWLDWAVRLTL